MLGMKARRVISHKLSNHKHDKVTITIQSFSNHRHSHHIHDTVTISIQSFRNHRLSKRYIITEGSNSRRQNELTTSACFKNQGRLV